jgi:catechol 2,3-dioxygenase-like lactoylglutathione lyase family enzyme
VFRPISTTQGTLQRIKYHPSPDHRPSAPQNKMIETDRKKEAFYGKAKSIGERCSPPGDLGGALKSGCALIAGAIAGGWKSAPASAQSEAPSNSVLHVAMNVADMERTTRFYTEVFGFFADIGAFKPDATSGKVFALGDNIALKVHSLRLGPVSILLRQFDDPKHVVESGYFPIHYLGLGNIAVRVADMDEAAAKVIEYGGKVEENTRALRAGVGPLMMFASDPDGIRIDLLKF